MSSNYTTGDSTMAESLADVPVNSTAWVDLNTAFGIAVGSSMEVTNKGEYTVYLYEGDTAPASNSIAGQPLTSTDKPYAVATIDEGSLTIWARCGREGYGVALTARAV